MRDRKSFTGANRRELPRELVRYNYICISVCISGTWNSSAFCWQFSSLSIDEINYNTPMSISVLNTQKKIRKICEMASEPKRYFNRDAVSEKRWRTVENCIENLTENRFCFWVLKFHNFILRTKNFFIFGFEQLSRVDIDNWRRWPTYTRVIYFPPAIKKCTYTFMPVIGKIDEIKFIIRSFTRRFGRYVLHFFRLFAARGCRWHKTLSGSKRRFARYSQV